ncbi:transcription elongation factor B polypeptide 1 [Trichuris trichiura]|uniref:Elongin-C n=1 Tax=Trichuris trichiura TaxID=36087 RepID=A0A077YYB0_TRITR|nr:transcription elongation factor B polypeptide 1 [Trichuris trichiura]
MNIKMFREFAFDEGPVVCLGPDAPYVKLVSSDNHEFVIRREVAMVAGTIRAMLSGPGQFAENETNIVRFREIPSHVLQKICHYLQYNYRFSNCTSDIPEFVVEPEYALELLMAANFLDC